MSIASNGSERWTRSYSSGFASSLLPSALLSDGQSNVYVLIDNNGNSADYGDGVTRSGSHLIKYNAAGQLAWVRSWTASSTLKADSTGNILAVSSDVSAASLACSGPAANGVYLAKIDTNGSCAWGRSLGGSLASGALEMDASDRIIVALRVSGTVDLGAGPLEAKGASDLLLAMFDPSGSLLWGGRYALTGTALLAVSSNGQLFVSGSFSGSLDLGAGAMLASAGATYLAKFNAVGQLLGQFQFTGNVNALSATPNGDALILSKDISLNFGAGPVFAKGGVALSRLRL